jgi:hypothetical protein
LVREAKDHTCKAVEHQSRVKHYLGLLFSVAETSNSACASLLVDTLDECGLWDRADTISIDGN